MNRNGAWRLTEPGRDYATQVVRAHRLWETYLAEETGLDESQWHARAHRREHELSRSEIDELAARIGNPTHDPHGDPIPTSEGDLPARAGCLFLPWPPEHPPGSPTSKTSPPMYTSRFEPRVSTPEWNCTDVEKEGSLIRFASGGTRYPPGDLDGGERHGGPAG